MKGDKNIKSLLVSGLSVEMFNQLVDLCKAHKFDFEIIEDNPKQTLSEEFDSVKAIEDSPRAKAEKKAVVACYNKVVAKKKVPWCRHYKVVENNLNVLSKKEQEEFKKLCDAVNNAGDESERFKANKKRQAFSIDMCEKYKKLMKLFNRGCEDYRSYAKKTTTK